MRRRALSLIAISVALAALPSEATAARRVIGHWYASDSSYFTGSACGETDTVTLRTRPRAFNIDVVTPLMGDSFEEGFNPGLTAAQITDISVDRGENGRAVVTWTATGSANVCPPAFTEGSWATGTIPFRVNYDSRERVYFPSRCYNASRRPTMIVVACGDAGLILTKMRWHGWDTTVAKGRGIARANDCDPYCAVGHFHSYRVKVRLYRAGYCPQDGRYHYRRLRLTYVGTTPGGPRSYGVPFLCRFMEI
jgi:hypothetical protein